MQRISSEFDLPCIKLKQRKEILILGKGFTHRNSLTSEVLPEPSIKSLKYLNIVIPFLCERLVRKLSRQRKLFLEYLHVLLKTKGIHQVYLPVGEP